MNKIKRISLLLFLSLLATSCGQSRESEKEEPTPSSDEALETAENAIDLPDNQLARITSPAGKDFLVENEEVEKQLNQLEAFDIPDNGGDEKSQVVSTLIFNKILADLAETRDLDETIIEPAKAEVLTQFEASLLDLEIEYDESNDFLRSIFENQYYVVALSKALESDINDPDSPVRKANPCASHILVEDEETANEVKARVESGEDFATVAVEESTGPSGPTGGVLGCAPPSTYVPEFKQALEEIEPGEIAGPIQTQFGWHIITLYEPAQADLENLTQTVLQPALLEYEVEVDSSVGVWDPNQFGVIPNDQAVQLNPDE